MTAYVNDEQKKEGAYGKAVKATLAATLAVGMVPAVAVAGEADDVAENNDVDLLVADNGFADAKVVAAYDNAGNELKDADKDGKFDLTFTGTSNYVKSLKLQLADGNETEVTVQNDNTYKFVYKKDNTEVQPNTVQAIADDYSLEIEYIGEGSYKGQKVTVKFEILAQQTESTVAMGMVSAVDSSKKATAVDTNIVFNGLTGDDLIASGTNDELGELALTVNGEVTPISAIQLYAANNTAAGQEIDAQNEMLYAGDYVAVVTYGASKKATVLFTVKPFDLSAATVSADAVDAAPKADAPAYTIAGVNDALKEQLTVKYDLGKNNNVPQASIVNMGNYVFTVAAKDDEKLVKSITGTKDFTVQYVGDIAKIQYDGQDWKAEFGPYVVGTSAFDANKVSFGTADAKYCSVKVFDAAGKEVTDWSTPGKYTVVAEVNDPTFATGGSKTATFVVSYDKAATDGIYVQYNGQLTTKIEKPYDGKDLTKNVSVKVVNGKKTMTEGVDYKLVYTDENGKEVSEVVDAGKYKLTVKPITFTFNDTSNTVDIKVSPIELTDLRVANQITVADKDGKTATGLPYTGSAIKPTFEYKTGEKDAEGNDVYAAVPADIYTVAYKFDSKYVDEVLKTGAYTAELTLNANVKNYGFSASLNSNTCTFKVIKKQRFIDVPADAWFAESVSTAAQKGWVKGYANGDLFGPYDSMTRADVCVVMARMAGVNLAIDTNAGSEINFFETPFDDVNGNMYYAQAIAWAADAGIVQGDGDTGNFRPNDEVTRSEFAAIMMRYAQKAGDSTVVEDGALDEYVDAASVPAWFKNEVSWAVESGIMGVGTDVLNPNGDITRAEVAAMLVRL